VTEGETEASDPLRDRAQVRMFTLADYVAEESSGKLYISGAGLEWTGVRVRSDSDGTSQSLSCYLMIRLAFPKASARSRHAIVVRALDHDGSPVGPNPLLEADMRFDLNRVPDDFAEVSGNLSVQVMDYPVTLDPDGVLFLHLVVDGTLRKSPASAIAARKLLTLSAPHPSSGAPA
jgi:hypothetical protein